MARNMSSRLTLIIIWLTSPRFRKNAPPMTMAAIRITQKIMSQNTIGWLLSDFLRRFQARDIDCRADTGRLGHKDTELILCVGIDNITGLDGWNRTEQSREATRVREQGMRQFKSMGQAQRFVTGKDQHYCGAGILAKKCFLHCHQVARITRPLIVTVLWMARRRKRATH